MYGLECDSFSMLSWFMEAVLETNPGSSVVLEVDESTERFKRVFVAYAGQIQGFKFSLSVLYVDGAFGKSKYKGQILVVTRRNGNKGFFPLALCFSDSETVSTCYVLSQEVVAGRNEVEFLRGFHSAKLVYLELVSNVRLFALLWSASSFGETEENWLFFFKHLKALLEPHGRIITFISDRGVGLLKAFDLIFPSNPHLYCYHHLRYNLSRKYKNKGGEIVVADVLQKLFKVAYASTEKSFYFHLKHLRDEGGATIIDEFRREIPLEHWCRAFFKDQTRMKEMKMMSERSVESKSWTTKLTPKMEKRLKEQLDRSRVFRVIASHENVYEVRNDKYSYSVDLFTCTCSCVKWQINCFSCAHAFAAIQGARLDVYDFIHYAIYIIRRRSKSVV
ncbi:hypothetical protein ACLB2K_073998 [Fragaria x ananassa]